MAANDPSLPEGTDQVITGAGTTQRDEVPTPPQGATTTGTGSASAPSTTGGIGSPNTASGSSDDGTTSSRSGSTEPSGRGAFFDRVEDAKAQGYDKARDYALMCKDRATGALDEFIQTINDAADQVESKVGGQYGDYVRRAAGGLGSFNDALKGKDVDELFRDARDLVARAPAIAVGTAAALGFVVARLAKAGLDNDTTSTGKDTSAT